MKLLLAVPAPSLRVLSALKLPRDRQCSHPTGTGWGRLVRSLGDTCSDRRAAVSGVVAGPCSPLPPGRQHVSMAHSLVRWWPGCVPRAQSTGNTTPAFFAAAALADLVHLCGSPPASCPGLPLPVVMQALIRKVRQYFRSPRLPLRFTEVCFTCCRRTAAELRQVNDTLQTARQKAENHDQTQTPTTRSAQTGAGSGVLP